MKNLLADRVYRLSESETLAMTRMGRELKTQGKDVISLSIGEPDFNTPEFIKDAAKKALDENYTHYTPVAGFEDLREAVCLKFKRDNNLDYKPENIVVSTGAKQSLANVVLSLVNPGDEVIVPTPFWVSYSEIIKLAEGKAVFIPANIENNFKVTPQQIQDAITDKTKVIMFNTPCNPSGSVYSKEEIKSIAEVVAKYPDVYIISDEIYEHINFVGKHESFAQFDFIKNQVIVVNGLSKGYAMTGWRLGYIAAPKQIAQACNKIQGQVTSGTSSISQRAAIAALNADPDKVDDMKIMVKAFKERRDLLLDLLKDIPGFKTNIPNGAFYVFPDISYYFGKSNGNHVINNSKDLCMYLLDTVYVALVPGSAFGNPDCIRFSYATSKDNLIEAVKRIKKAVSYLK